MDDTERWNDNDPGMTDARALTSADGKGSELEKTDPGASKYGNFMNYYQFHPAGERVRQLPRGVWRSSHSDRKYVALDVGCNSGDLTLALRDHLSSNLKENDEFSILGIDLDPVLIERACEKNDHVQEVTFQCLDFFSDKREQFLQGFLQLHGRTRFDVVFCFSVTMWIHLNHGDSGLRQFLHDICNITDMVVIEPQKWKSYNSAARRLRRANAGHFTLLDTIQNKHNIYEHIEYVLNHDCGFKKVIITESNNWNRQLLIYKRIL